MGKQKLENQAAGNSFRKAVTTPSVEKKPNGLLAATDGHKALRHPAHRALNRPPRPEVRGRARAAIKSVQRNALPAYPLRKHRHAGSHTQGSLPQARPGRQRGWSRHAPHSAATTRPASNRAPASMVKPTSCDEGDDDDGQVQHRHVEQEELHPPELIYGDPLGN